MLSLHFCSLVINFKLFKHFTYKIFLYIRNRNFKNIRFRFILIWLLVQIGNDAKVYVQSCWKKYDSQKFKNSNFKSSQ